MLLFIFHNQRSMTIQFRQGNLQYAIFLHEIKLLTIGHCICGNILKSIVKATAKERMRLDMQIPPNIIYQLYYSIFVYAKE